MQTNIEKQIREANTRKAKQSEIQAKVDQEVCFQQKLLFIISLL